MKGDIMDTVGSRIKWLRTSKGLNQKEFCEKINLAQSRLSEIESNKTKPSFDTLLAIKESFGISLDWLVSGDGYNETNEHCSANGYLSEEERELIEKYRSGLHPIFDSDIKRLTGDVGRLNDQEHDLILKYRELEERERDDIYDNVCWKYDRLLKKKMLSRSMNGGTGEEAATNETA